MPRPVYMLSPEQTSQQFDEQRQEALRRARRLVAALLDLEDHQADTRELLNMRALNNVLYHELTTLGGEQLAILPRPAPVGEVLAG